MRWVVFDYGEVIGRRTGALPSLAAVLGVSPEDFEEVYFAERNAYDRGCGDLPYWRAVGKRLGVRIDAALVERLTGADVAGWLETASCSAVNSPRRSGGAGGGGSPAASPAAKRAASSPSASSDCGPCSQSCIRRAT